MKRSFGGKYVGAAVDDRTARHRVSSTRRGGGVNGGKRIENLCIDFSSWHAGDTVNLKRYMYYGTFRAIFVVFIYRF